MRANDPFHSTFVKERERKAKGEKRVSGRVYGMVWYRPSSSAFPRSSYTFWNNTARVSYSIAYLPSPSPSSFHLHSSQPNPTHPPRRDKKIPPSLPPSLPSFLVSAPTTAYPSTGPGGFFWLYSDWDWKSYGTVRYVKESLSPLANATRRLAGFSS